MGILIAEIGNNAFGDIVKAKELIQAAHESGADLIKGQAYTQNAIKGSMPVGFYEASRFTEEDYLDLIDYAKTLGATLFYSIFLKDDNDRGLDRIIETQMFNKCAAFQTKDLTEAQRSWYDSENSFISVPQMRILPYFDFANILHVSDYLTTKPNLERIPYLAEVYGRHVGYSDHTEGIDICLEALRCFGAKIIEKHFTLKKNEEWGGQVFRDTVHGATPNELEKLSKHIKGE